jgi:hypothetical protein
MKHFFLIKSDLRNTNNVERKKGKKKKLPLLGLEPAPLSYNAVDNLNTLQSGGNALSGSYLKGEAFSQTA